MKRERKNRIIRNTFYAQLSVFVLSSVTTSVGTLVDGVIIGRYLGVDSMAAFGVVSPLMIVFSLAGAIVSAGARNRFTRLVGSGEIRKAQGVFSLSCILSVGIAALLMLFILPFATPVTAMLGASGNTAALLPKARAYLISIALGLPAMNAVRTLNGYMAIDNDRNLPVIASVVLTVSDIILDLVAAFVLHGDTFEIGMATSISYYLAAAVLLLHFRRKNNLLKFIFRGIPWREAGGILQQGMSVGVCRVGNTLRSAYMNRLLSVIAGSAAIAAYSVHRQTDSFLNPLTIGMADTVAMIAGVLMGEEDRPMIKRLLKTSVQASFSLTLGISVICWMLAPKFAALYIRDNAEALELSVRAVRCYILGMPLYGLNLSYANYFQGIGRSRPASVTDFLLECVFLVPSAGVMSRWAGPDAVWLAFPVTQVLMLIYYVILVSAESRRIGIHRENWGSRAILLPDTFDVAAEDCMDRSIRTMDEVGELSKAVWKFCEAHGCDERRRYLMSLSVEEMVGNVILHGFSKDRRNHSADVRVMKKGEDFILRIRDDCLIFDPVAQLQLYSEEDPAHHIGLRMIIRTAKNVQYTSILKLNNLVIRV